MHQIPNKLFLFGLFPNGCAPASTVLRLLNRLAKRLRTPIFEACVSSATASGAGGGGGGGSSGALGFLNKFDSGFATAAVIISPPLH
jgi:hypothetical protein